MTSKRERLERTLSGEAVDRPPVVLWRHWLGDEQRAADLAAAVWHFQVQFDWDILCAAPASNYSVSDYGLTDAWQGDLYGMRAVLKPVIDNSLAWTELRPLDVLRGDIGKYLAALQLLSKRCQEDKTPLLAVVYSPLAQARRLAGETPLLRHMRQQPERLRTGLNVLTDNTLRFVDALRKSGVNGIYYVVEHAHYDAMGRDEYAQFGLPYDGKVLQSVHTPLELCVLSVAGDYPMLELLARLPVHALNWRAHAKGVTFEQARTLFTGALMGGLDSAADLHDGTPSHIRSQARRAQQLASGRKFLLSCNGAGMMTTPLSHWRAAREAYDDLK